MCLPYLKFPDLLLEGHLFGLSCCLAWELLYIIFALKIYLQELSNNIQFPGPKIHNNISECKGQTSYELELFGQHQVKITDFEFKGKSL